MGNSTNPDGWERSADFHGNGNDADYGGNGVSCDDGSDGVVMTKEKLQR